MAFNWQTFRTRTLTAAVFVAVMLVGLLWNHWSFFILFSVIHFGCWWEYLKLTEKIHKTSFHIYTKLGLMLMGYAVMLWFCGPVYKLFGYGLKENFSLPVSAAGFILLTTGIFQKNIIKLKAVGFTVLGLLYISLSWGLMMYLYDFNYSVVWWVEPYRDKIHSDVYKFNYPYAIPLAIIISIWINDTMAYITGSLIGRTPLSSISPKKTWEGTIGGIILSVVAAGTLFSNIFELNTKNIFLYINNPTWYFFAGVAAISGTFGDLFESKLKRMAGVKDSGTLMPGHGGFLDRFDSLLFATPFVWLYVLFFLK